MRVVHYSRGALQRHTGANAVTRGWSRAHAEQGLDVTLAVHPGRVRTEPPPGVNVHALLHRGSGRLSVPADDSWLDGADLAVIHAGWRPANVVAARMASKARVPYVVTAHGVYIRPVLERNPFLKKLWLRSAERRFLQRALAVHVYFEEEIDDLRAIGVDSPVVVAPCGFDPPATRWAGGKGAPLIWLGRFDIEHKGLDLLVEAVRLLAPEKRPTIAMHGLEQGDGKERLATLIARAGLDRWIVLREPVTGAAKWDALAHSAGLVYPSRFEAFGMSVMEAASIGAPVLATSYPLATNLAEQGGAIVVDASAEGIASGFEEMASARASEVGAAAARVVRSTFDWRAVARSWIEDVARLMV